MFFLQPPPEFRELVRSKVSQNLAIHVDDWGKVLSGKSNHFVESRFIRHHIHGLIIDALRIQPSNRFVAPPAEGFDK
jgi:hypothetical protein